MYDATLRRRIRTATLITLTISPQPSSPACTAVRTEHLQHNPLSAQHTGYARTPGLGQPLRSTPARFYHLPRAPVAGQQCTENLGSPQVCPRRGQRRPGQAAVEFGGPPWVGGEGSEPSRGGSSASVLLAAGTRGRRRAQRL